VCETEEAQTKGGQRPARTEFDTAKEWSARWVDIERGLFHVTSDGDKGRKLGNQEGMTRQVWAQGPNLASGRVVAMLDLSFDRNQIKGGLRCLRSTRQPQVEAKGNGSAAVEPADQSP